MFARTRTPAQESDSEIKKTLARTRVCARRKVLDEIDETSRPRRYVRIRVEETVETPFLLPLVRLDMGIKKGDSTVAFLLEIVVVPANRAVETPIPSAVAILADP